jgi:hypothetical protein
VGFLLVGIDHSKQTEAVQSFISLLALIMLPLGAFLFWRGRQHETQWIADSALYDSKPDVLYLRAFETDPSFLYYLLKVLFVHQAFRTAISGTEEEQLREALEPFGDLIAIGKPGETLPTPGAGRLYASDDKWKNVVAKQMKRARLVVIRAGSSAGLLWELEQAVQILSPKKIIILVLNMWPKKYETFRKEAERTFKCAFPKADEIKRFWRISGFIRFSSNWEPSFLPLRLPYYRGSIYKPYRRHFKFTLRPVFQEYGLDWQPPPLSISRLLQLLFLGLVIIILVIVLLSAIWCSTLGQCSKNSSNGTAMSDKASQGLEGNLAIPSGLPRKVLLDKSSFLTPFGRF